jgi:OHCU decarboxylase
MTDETQPRLTSIAILNQLPPDEFAAALRPLFEAAGPLARALYAGRPYTSYDDLLERAESMATGLATEEQIEVVNSHPRIGENASVVRRQSSLAYREQGYDHEASLPAEDVQRTYAALAELNRAYEDRFGFRFVIFVDKRPKSEVVEILRDRLQKTRNTELETALRALFSIARDRRRQLT